MAAGGYREGRCTAVLASSTAEPAREFHAVAITQAAEVNEITPAGRTGIGFGRKI